MAEQWVERLMWFLQVEADRRVFLCYRPVLVNENHGPIYRIAELHDGPPSLNDITCIQNYLQSYKAVPVPALCQ